VVDPVMEGAGEAHTLSCSLDMTDCLGTTCSDMRPGTRFSRSSMSMPGPNQLDPVIVCSFEHESDRGVLTPENSTSWTVWHTTGLLLSGWSSSLEHHHRTAATAIKALPCAYFALRIGVSFHITLTLWDRFEEFASVHSAIVWFIVWS
jgi:hypothetical protein